LFDLCFFANLGWLLLLIPGISTQRDTAFDFWQLYFLTLPHRWITLFLVLTDTDRRAGRGPKLGLIALLLLLLVIGIAVGTGGFLCLAVVDFLWNAWHFASQHAGILRVYSRKVGSRWDWLERWGLRLFVSYTLVRTVEWTTGWLQSNAFAVQLLAVLDLGLLGVPVLLLCGLRFNRESAGKNCYLLSVCGLYSLLLLAIANEWAGWVLSLATASAIFHATEYLAIVTHYAWRRERVGSAGLFREFASRWLTFLSVYVVLLGLLGFTLDSVGGAYAEFWLGANLWAALTHYAFDGMIWKLRRPETAQALGATANTEGP
jgi:hypothetical protein